MKLKCLSTMGKYMLPVLFVLVPSVSLQAQCKPPALITCSAGTNFSKSVFYEAFISPDGNGLKHFYLTKEETDQISVDSYYTYNSTNFPFAVGSLFSDIQWEKLVPSGTETNFYFYGTNSASGVYSGLSSATWNLTGSMVSNTNDYVLPYGEWDTTVIVASSSYTNEKVGPTYDAYDGTENDYLTYFKVLSGTTTNFSPTKQIFFATSDDSFGNISSNLLTTTLTNEFTDAMLAAQISAQALYPTNVDGSYIWTTNEGKASVLMAFSHWIPTNDAVASNHVAASGGKTQFYFHLDPCVKDKTYYITWKQTTVFDDPNQAIAFTNPVVQVIGNGDSTNGVNSTKQILDIPTNACSISFSDWSASITDPRAAGEGGPSHSP